jgi:hypothetical protein
MYQSSAEIVPSKEDQKPGWYYLKLDDDFSRYYNFLCNKQLLRWQMPMNGCHCTVIAGEKEGRIVSQSEALSFLGKDMFFQYDGLVYTDGRTFWMNIESEDLRLVRETLGLKPRTLHITLGNLKGKI